MAIQKKKQKKEKQLQENGKTKVEKLWKLLKTVKAVKNGEKKWKTVQIVREKKIKNCGGKSENNKLMPKLSFLSSHFLNHKGVRKSSTKGVNQ